MNICIIGKHIYPKDIFSNEQDMKTWRSMAAYFDKLFVIAQSPDLSFHFGKENNISVYLIPRLGYLIFIKLAVILGFYLNIKYDIDVFDASEVAGGGIAAALLKIFTKKLIVTEIQGEIFRKPERKQNFPARGWSALGGKSWLLKKIGRFVLKKSDRIRVISHAIFNQVKGQGIAENKIRLVSLRVDLDLFNSNLRVSDTHKRITIGYVGRLIEGKGLEDLLTAMSNVKCQMSNVVLLIYGSGSLEFKLKKLADELKIKDKIEWRGFVPYGKVPEALSQIDIFVYPSWHEGFGRSIMEALAMEKAVVATRVGGIPDLIKDNENGFLVSPHNPQELAQKISILVKDKNLREKFGKAGREWVSENYEWNQGIKKFANLFLELK